MTSAADLGQPSAPVGRTLSDRCPGLLRPHTAEDGVLVRLRLPGGRTTSATLLELSRIAGRYGEGSVQLTSRGNIQLRGLDTDRLPDLVEEVAAAELLPSVSHERVRNVVASPLTGLAGGRADLRPMVSELDHALCGSPELVELPGRFLFALDDGTGDVASLAYDLAYRARDESRGTILVGGRGDWGVPVGRAEAVTELIALAQAFVRLRDTLPRHPWHVAELADPRLLDPRFASIPAGALAGPTALGRRGEAASVGVPLSLLGPPQVDAIHTAAAGGAVVITPWRGVIIASGASRLPELAAAGLVTDEDSVWSQLTACIGAPGCAKSAISTRALATEVAAALDSAPALPVHLSGCARRCGAPSGRHADLVAPPSLRHALAEIGSAR